MNFDDKVVYQIYPKSFLDTDGNGYGDIKGIITKLDYIKDLGVDYIWLSPICTSPQYDNGYDIADYYHIDPLFGTDEDYDLLIKEANKRGMKIMLDLVLNHVSSEHEWFKKALNGDEKYLDYFIWRDEPNELQSAFSRPAWTYNEQVGKYYFHLFDEHQPDLNWENPIVREEIYKMVNYWIDKGVEGFRLDVIDLIGKEPDRLITGHGPNFIKYLNELNNQTFKDKILTVGECWNSDIAAANKMCNENALSQVFHFTHLTQTSYGEKWDQIPLEYQKIIKIIKLWQNEYDGSQTQVINNHDMPRLVSLWLNDTTYRYECATLLHALFGLLRGTTYLYQGEEIGMVNANMRDIRDYNDVETLNKYEVFKKEGVLTEEEIMNKIKLMSRDNARTPMQWDDSPHAGFTSGTPWLKLNERYKEINVASDLASDKSVYKKYQELIKFKKDNLAMMSGKIKNITFNDDIIHYEKDGFKFSANMSESVKCFPSKNVVLSNYQDINDSNLLPYQFIVEFI